MSNIDMKITKYFLMFNGKNYKEFRAKVPFRKWIFFRLVLLSDRKSDKFHRRIKSFVTIAHTQIVNIYMSFVCISIAFSSM